MIPSKLALAAIISLSLCQCAYGRGLRKKDGSMVSTPIHRVSSDIIEQGEAFYPIKATSYESLVDTVAGLNPDGLDGLAAEVSIDDNYSMSTKVDEDNRDMQSVTTITVKNDCSNDVLRTYVWDGTSSYQIIGFFLYPDQSRTFTTTRDFFQIHSESLTSDYELEAESGNLCWQSGGCFVQEDISNDDIGGSVIYSITCGESSSSSSTSSTSPPASSTATTSSTTSTGPPASSTTTTSSTTSSSSTTTTNPPANNNNQWLIQHNDRRKKYHDQYGKSYVPLVWSTLLEQKAQAWADELIQTSIDKDECYFAHANSDEFQYGGENLAKNWGTSSSPPTEDSVLTRWTEDEEFDDWPANGHFTQVIWRATTELGCAVGHMQLSNGYHCHIQVCRYSVPGNCNVFQGNFFEPMLKDTSPCSNR